MSQGTDATNAGTTASQIWKYVKEFHPEQATSEREWKAQRAFKNALVDGQIWDKYEERSNNDVDFGQQINLSTVIQANYNIVKTIYNKHPEHADFVLELLRTTASPVPGSGAKHHFSTRIGVTKKVMMFLQPIKDTKFLALSTNKKKQLTKKRHLQMPVQKDWLGSNRW